MNEETGKRNQIAFHRLDRLYREIRQDERLSDLLYDSIPATEKEKRILTCLYGALKEKDKCQETIKQCGDDTKINRNCVSLEILCDTLEAELDSE